jgi:hypothetical protein
MVGRTVIQLDVLILTGTVTFVTTIDLKVNDIPALFGVHG